LLSENRCAVGFAMVNRAHCHAQRAVAELIEVFSFSTSRCVSEDYLVGALVINRESFVALGFKRETWWSILAEWAKGILALASTGVFVAHPVAIAMNQFILLEMILASSGDRTQFRSQCGSTRTGWKYAHAEQAGRKEILNLDLLALIAFDDQI